MGRLKHYIYQIKNGKLKDMYQQIAWIYKYAGAHLFSIIMYTLLGLSGTVVSLISSLVSRDLVDIITGHRTGELVETFCIMIGVTLGSSFIGQLSGYVSSKINMKVDNYIKADVFDKIMETRWESLAKFHSGDLVMRWNSDAGNIATGILNLVPNFIIYSFRFVSALYMVVKYDASFAIFALASVPVSIITSREALNRMKKNNMSSMAIGAKLSGFNQETFANIQTVKAFDMLPLYSQRLRELQKDYTDIRLKYQKMVILNSMVLTIVSMAVSYSAHGWGIYKVWSGAISYGTMTMFLTLSTTLSGSVNNLITLIPSTISLTNSAKRLQDIIGLPKEDYAHREEVKAFYEKHRDEGVGLCIQNATYGYREDEDVFVDTNVEAHPHEIVAFVGPSGEGKTTMLRLLLSIVQAKSGAGYICAGNHTPENCQGEMVELTASTRQLFAYVPQGNTMFSGTIAENMRNVKVDATDEEIIDALKIACAWDFVEKLPEGINSVIQERGGGFSEGQAQRLSIARAVLRRSPILLLDEATSALDPATERKVLQNIMQDKYPRTSIVTTHRPTVLGLANRVYSISDKKCVVLSEEEIQRKLAGE